MKFLTVLIILFAFLNYCGKSTDKDKIDKKKKSFKINPEFEKPYSPENLKIIKELNVPNAVYIYIQHLKEELVWNKRINYMLDKQKQNSGNKNHDEFKSSQKSYSENFTDTFIKYKEKYEKIFFEKIGISRKKWEDFVAKHYKEIQKYRQENPDMEKEITKYSRMLQDQQQMMQN